MNKMIGIVALCMLLVGCGHNDPAPKTAADSFNPLPDKCQDRPCVDNFDRAGSAVADGSRYVWNESKKAYEWATSEENKERAEKVWTAAKDTVKRTYDEAMKAYDERANK